MRILLFLIVIFLLMTIEAYSQVFDYDDHLASALDSSDYVILENIPTQTGYVSNWGLVNTLANGSPSYPYNMGFSNYSDYRAIYTFDTSVIPNEATITTVLLWNGVIIDFPYSYIFDNTAIDFAYPYGFGGTHIITNFDYYALPATSFYTVIANAAIGGLMLNLDKNQQPRDLNPFINRYGKTQIRLRFFQNPDKHILYFTGLNFEDPDVYTTYLVVAWE